MCLRLSELGIVVRHVFFLELHFESGMGLGLGAGWLGWGRGWGWLAGDLGWE